MNKQELNRFIDKISPTGPGGIEKIKKVLKLVLDREGEGKEGEEGITEASYSDLKTLRDNGQLIPGHLYRITDYITTTVQEGTRSAGHQFDIIVQAITENTLSEDARAIQHKFVIPESTFSTSDDGTATLQGIEEIEGIKCYVYRYGDFYYAINIDNLQYVQDNPRDDFRYFFLAIYCKYQDEPWYENDDFGTLLGFTQDIREFTYFSNSNLAAWKLKYCLDNDTDRFAWARTEAQLSPVSHQKILRLLDDNHNTFIYVRCSEKDSENECAWAYDGSGDDRSIQKYITNGNETLETNDLIYTASEDVSIGDVLDMSGIQVTVIEVSQPEGKGIIYQMIDEHNNNCPYDFKNILFLRNRGWHNEHTEWAEAVIGEDPDRDIYYFTFSWINATTYTIEDVSVVAKIDDAGNYTVARNNTILEYIDDFKKIALNNIILVASSSYDTGILYEPRNNVFKQGCYNCTFGNNIQDNVFDYGFKTSILSGAVGECKSFGAVADWTLEEEIYDKIIYSKNTTIKVMDIDSAFSGT